MWGCANDSDCKPANPSSRRKCSPRIWSNNTTFCTKKSGLLPDCQAMDKSDNFVVATPGRSVCDDNARALYHHGSLRFLALGTRRGTAGVPPEFTRLNPKIGLVAYAAARTLSVFHAESFRFRLHPWFDHW